MAQMTIGHFYFYPRNLRHPRLKWSEDFLAGRCSRHHPQKRKPRFVSLRRRVTIALHRLAGGVEFLARPEEAAGHEVEISGVRHGLIHVTKRRAEHAAAAIVVGPHDGVVV